MRARLHRVGHNDKGGNEREKVAKGKGNSGKGTQEARKGNQHNQ